MVRFNVLVPLTVAALHRTNFTQSSPASSFLHAHELCACFRSTSPTTRSTSTMSNPPSASRCYNFAAYAIALLVTAAVVVPAAIGLVVANT
jgi:hypothetical protein